MTTYQSSFSGPEIDSSVSKAQTALQPGDVAGGGGVTEYPTVAELPMSGVEQGTLALVKETLQGDSAVFIWNGSTTAGGWYKLATVNLAPTIVSGPDPEYVLPNDGTPVTLELVAEDPEGLPISWSYVLAEGSVEGVAVVTQDGSTFTVAADPAAVAAQAGGVFSLTFKADDGVSVAGATAEFTLSFAAASRFLAVGASTGYRLGTFDLGAEPVSFVDGLINSSIYGIAWINRELVVVNTLSSSNNPQFAIPRESDGDLSRVFEEASDANSVASSALSSAAASKDGLWCAITLQNSPYVAFYAITDGVPSRVLPFGTLTTTGRSVEFHPSGDFCVVSDIAETVHVFDLRSGTPTPTQYTGLSSALALHFQFSADGTKLYFADNGRADSKVVVADFDAETGAVTNVRPVGTVTTNVQDLHVSADGVFLCVGTNNTPVFDLSVDPVSPSEIVFTGSYIETSAQELIFSQDMKLAALRMQSSSIPLRLYDFDAATRTLTERTITDSPATIHRAMAFQPSSG